MMQIGDIYYNDDIGYHILILETQNPYHGWCTVFILETSEINWFAMFDIGEQIYGWKKIS